MLQKLKVCTLFLSIQKSYEKNHVTKVEGTTPLFPNAEIA